MKSFSIATTFLAINRSIAQEYTYPPTSSETSLAHDAHVHTVAPTGSVVRFPRPTPVPGTETYWPTTDAAFLDYTMQIVEVAGSPVPTVIRLNDVEEPVDKTEVYIETADEEVVEVNIETTDEEVVVVEDVFLTDPAMNEDAPNSSEKLRGIVLSASLVFGAPFFFWR